MSKQPYVDPRLIKEEVSRFRNISEYNYFTSVAEEDEKKDDQLTMDDFNAPAPGGQVPAPEGGQPPVPGGQPPAPEGGQPPAEPGMAPADPFGTEAAPEGGMPEADAAAPAAGEPAQEIDMTDIVQVTKAVNQKTDEMGQKIDQTLQKVDGLLQKINGLEQNVQKMDQVVNKINAIYQEVELSKPPSPEEVKEIMAQKSYPFNVQLDKYGQEGTPKNQTELEGKKNKLSLSNLLSDFNERELRQSFNPPDPFEDKLARTLPAYRI